MTKTLERIEQDVFDASNDGQMPHITLQAFRLGIEAVRQLRRIADTLQRPKPPDLRAMTANSLRPQDLSEGHLEAIEQVLGEVATGDELHLAPEDCPEKCVGCKYEHTCCDYMPF